MKKRAPWSVILFAAGLSTLQGLQGCAGVSSLEKLKVMGPEQAYRHGLELAQEGEYSLAVAMFYKAQQDISLKALAMKGLLDVYLAQKDYERYILDAEKYLETQAYFDKTCRLNLIKILIQQGQYPRALKHIELAQKLGPQSQDLFLMKALAYKHQGQWNDVQKVLSSLLLISPNHKVALSFRAQANFELKRELDAITDLTKLADLKSLSIQESIILVNSHDQLGQTDMAIDKINFAISEYSNSTQLLNLKAQLLVKTGKLSEAILVYEQLNDIDPKDVKVLISLAQNLRALGKEEQAKEVLKNAHTLFQSSPDNAQFSSELAKQALEANNLFAAGEIYLQNFQKNPSQSWAAFGLSQIYLTLGNEDASLEVLQKHARVNPSVEVFKKMAILYSKRADPTAALQAIESGLKHFPQDEHLRILQTTVGKGQLISEEITDKFQQTSDESRVIAHTHTTGQGKKILNLLSKGDMIDFVVRPGDTLQILAKYFYDSYRQWEIIYNANQDRLKNPAQLKVGQVLRIPKMNNQ